MTEPTKEQIEAAARASHDAYEQAAKQFGWDTKPECRVEFDDLPDANKKTMFVAMEAALRAALEVKPDVLPFDLNFKHVRFGKGVSIQTVIDAGNRWHDEASKAAFPQLNESAEKLQRFKDYVHKRLDDAGIPTHPEGEHSQHGCRIGDRLDIALNESAIRADERKRVVEECAKMCEELVPFNQVYAADECAEAIRKLEGGGE